MLLKVENLSKRFGGLVAVSDVSFGIEKGEIIGIFGPNGSGKTTLLNLLAGLLPPSAGRVFWKGQDIAGARPNVIAALGVIKTFQNPQLFSELSVFEHVMIASFLAFARMKNQSRRLSSFLAPGRGEAALRVRAERALTLCRLQDASEKTAAELSYGEEKMLGVAMAMMCEPELLLLDEPASGLGNDEIHNLENVLRDLRAQGTTLCIIDHKVAFLAKFADQAIALQQGCKIAEGRPHDVLADPGVVKAYLGRSHHA
jgi:ABC-type branched-subunit amino acid transport system ATPase component